VASATIKIANTIAGLGAATGICLQTFKCSIKKNIESIFCLGGSQLSANVNKNFNVSGDFEAIYSDNTYRDLFTGNTKQAVQIEIVGKTLIGATQYNKITIQFAQVGFDSWERSGGNDDLIKETVGFTAEYNLTNTQTMNVVLQNVKSTAY
jgi:Phage tail tube protein